MMIQTKRQHDIYKNNMNIDMTLTNNTNNKNDMKITNVTLTMVKHLINIINMTMT